MIAHARSDTRGLVLATFVTGVAAACWVVASNQMSGMDMGPRGDLASFPFFTTTWATMMAAMMLPSALPAVLSFDRIAQGRRDRAAGVSSVVFVASYLAVWTAVGVAAYVGYAAVRAADVGFLAWGNGGRYVTGAAVLAAGIYELTPLKRVCLRQCRAPADGGPESAVWLGIRYGRECVGCSAGLMVVLLAVGVTSVFWMLVVALLVFAEKVPAVGAQLVVPVALLLLGLGIWIALVPSSVPGLSLPT